MVPEERPDLGTGDRIWGSVRARKSASALLGRLMLSVASGKIRKMVAGGFLTRFLLPIRQFKKECFLLRSTDPQCTVGTKRRSRCQELPDSSPDSSTSLAAKLKSPLPSRRITVMELLPQEIQHSTQVLLFPFSSSQPIRMCSCHPVYLILRYYYDKQFETPTCDW